MNGYYKVLTGAPGRPKRYATKEEIPKELTDKYEVVFVPEDEKKSRWEEAVKKHPIEFTEGEPIEGEKPGDNLVERPVKLKRGRKPKALKVVEEVPYNPLDPTAEFTEGEKIENETVSEVTVGRPIPIVAAKEPSRTRRHGHRHAKGKSEEGESQPEVQAEAQAEAPAPEKEPETPAECTPDDVNVESDLVNITYLLRQTNEELRKLATANGVRRVPELRRQDLIYEIMRTEYAKFGFRFGKGVLDIQKFNNYGFLRRSERNYRICEDDVYVSPTQIRRFRLQRGDTIYGVFRRPRNSEKSGAVIKVAAVNLDAPDSKANKTPFDELTPQFSAERFLMEYKPDGVSTRIMDLISPIGKGQRGLIVAPPRAGKTLLLRDIANAISHNNPSAELIMLLIDERPEEVTDMQRSVRGEVISSTFDESGDRHLAVAEMVLEKAKRLVEHGKDVIILLDSLTRLARAYNSGHNLSGKTLSGGMDANALQKPKRFFGSARSCEGGGSLTIIATALIETGSRMDDLIYEEFKGTGNMECVLDRRISEKRVFPAIDIDRSGTRKEELLFDAEELKKVWLLRNMLSGLSPLQKIERLIDQVKLTSSNAELLMMLRER
ncbi:transcription termination factor Rho [bacterium]|nr:transcription termination factor Rho [bacterium]